MNVHIYIKLKPRTTVAVTNKVRTTILEAAYVMHRSQHCTKIQKVRADYT